MKLLELLLYICTWNIIFGHDGMHHITCSKDIGEKAHVDTEGNEQADKAAKEGTAGGSHMKETQTPIPWQVAKGKIEEHTTSKWKHKWISEPQ